MTKNRTASFNTHVSDAVLSPPNFRLGTSQVRRCYHVILPRDDCRVALNSLCLSADMHSIVNCTNIRVCHQRYALSYGPELGSPVTVSFKTV